jgi:SprT protein
LTIQETLSKYIPVEAVDVACHWMKTYNIELKITRSRNSKLGDYRHPYGVKGHRITVNHDLNKYAFLVTFVHEVAHLTTWEKHRNKVQPHGAQWKNSFQELLIPILNQQVFPEDITRALERYINNPGASSCSDSHLLRTLRLYDEKTPTNLEVHVEDLPIDTIFQLKNGMIFKKGEQLRKRFKCTELRSKRTYLVNPLAEAIVVLHPKAKGQFGLF